MTNPKGGIRYWGSIAGTQQIPTVVPYTRQENDGPDNKSYNRTALETRPQHPLNISPNPGTNETRPGDTPPNKLTRTNIVDRDLMAKLTGQYTPTQVALATCTDSPPLPQ
ncbi:Hypothetical predicted protein [Pelobates cultripes]|uniref:Uncharacterized protein n=1 Tax=Pelobates cultripes TaxID=61616 RepID=A0AAD1SE42_PELCU|nr:Hypothetical predicted protein [Pelobates cultripes]